MRTLNQIQTLTPAQQEHCYFAIVETDQVQADGTRQNAKQAMVRLRDGSMAYVRDLPQISPDDPQPNGDYQVVVNNDHDSSVASQSGIGWLYIGADGYLHMMYCLSSNKAARDVEPLARDNMLSFSTEGDLYGMADDGKYGDFWITCVAPVQVGNDPGTQTARNSKKGGIMPDETKKQDTQMDYDTIKDLVSKALNAKNADTKDPGAVMSAVAKLFTQLGITDPKWMADITSDFLSASAGLPYHMPGEPDDTPTPSADTTDDNVATANKTAKDENTKTNAKSVNVGGYKPVVNQQTGTQTVHVVQNAFEKFREGPEYKEAFGQALLKGFRRSGADSNAAEPIENALKKNDISFDPDQVSLTPEYLISRVTELLQSSNNILSHISMYNGLNQYTVPAFVTQTTYAHGRARGATGEKKSQDAKIDPRLIVAQSLFKYVSLPADFVDNAGGLSGSAVVDWVNRELPAKVIRAAEEALLVGGVTNDDNEGSPYTAISSIVDDVTAAGSVYGTVYQRQASESMLQALSTQVANVELLDNALEQTGVWLVISRTDYRALLGAALMGDGKYPANLAGNAEQLAAFLGIDGIIQVPWLRPAARETGHNSKIDDYTTNYEAMLVNLSAVYGVGELTPTALSQYYLRANTYDFESKIRLGAALGAPWSVVLIKRPTQAA
ncbi:MAG: hypothetical protein [Bacteriophage sp.]|nr:MAG: hypothetical protein [Bacteriophage sp.]